ncbi:MAG: hypothetical protein R2742_07750 [Micropruina glycogenica]
MTLLGAADLKARLQLLGFDTVADFQRDQGLASTAKTARPPGRPCWWSPVRAAL